MLLTWETSRHRVAGAKRGRSCASRTPGFFCFIDLAQRAGKGHLGHMKVREGGSANVFFVSLFFGQIVLSPGAVLIFAGIFSIVKVPQFGPIFSLRPNSLSNKLFCFFCLVSATNTIILESPYSQNLIKIRQYVFAH